MALITCKECGHKISKKAKVCPQCGFEKRSRRSGCLLWSIFIVLGPIGLLVIIDPEPRLMEASQNNSASTSSSSQDRVREEVWINRGIEAVRARLKDPGSAEFKGTFFSTGKGGIPVACGQVNSKNSLGAFIGYQRFVSGGEELTFIENEVEGFDEVWTELCVR